MGDVRAEYRFLRPQLVAAGYRVVTLDVRGMGETSVRWPDYSVAAIGADALALKRALSEQPAILIGDSMASGAAVWAAAEAPDAFAALVLMDPVVHDMGPSWLMQPVFGALLADPWGASFWASYYASLYRSQRPADFPAYRAALKANLQEKGRLAAFRRMIMASKAASAARLARVTTPAFVIMGSKDPDFSNPEREAKFITSQLQQASMRMIDGVGHYPHAEAPDVTGPAIVAWLNETLGRA
jgi:pimeloyl-ACP methyl ester carboxylesterase